METKTQIEHYSELLQNDIVILLNVKFDKVEDSYISGVTGKGEPVESSYLAAHFLSEDVTILNTNLRDDVAKEFFEYFANYEDDIRELIEEEINN